MNLFKDKFNIFNFSLNFKLVFIFLIIQAIIIISISYIYMFKFSAIFEGQFTERGKSLAYYLADSIKYAVLTKDISSIEEKVKEVLHQPDVVGVRVLDNSGNILYTNCWTEKGNIQIFKALVKTQEKFSEDEDILNFSVPKRIKESGIVEICMSKDRLDTQLSKLQDTVMYIAIAEFLGAFFIGIIIFNKLIISRINYLTEKVKQISKNPLTNVKITVDGNDEITTLANCFNIMQQELKKYIEENIEKTKRLKEQEKLALLGRFASELRHEVGNSLNDFTAIYSRLKKEELSQEGKKILDDFIFQIEELKKFNNNIKNCFQTPEPELEYIDLTEFLRGQRSAMGLFFNDENNDDNKRLEFVWHIPDKECILMIDSSMIRRALENLIRNAIDAVNKKKGKIEIGLDCFDEYVELWVKDNGTGIPEEIRDKIFDPFVTSKAHGSGLGLGITKSFIEKAHKGKLILDTSNGTKFIMRIPRNLKLN